MVLGNDRLSADNNVEFHVSEIVVVGENPLTDGHTSRILASFLGKHKNLERLSLAARTLQDAIHEKGFRLASVVLPPQDITKDDGAVTLKITNVKIESVGVQGEKHYSEWNIKRSLPPLKEGSPVNVKSIDRSVTVANKHPDKNVSVKFSPARRGNYVDAEVQVQDEKPYRTNAWVNDTGSKRTGETRIGASWRYSNVADRDHEIRVSYSTSVRQPSDVAQYGLTYSAPIYPVHGKLLFYGSRSDTDSGTIADVLDVKGNGTVLGWRYIQNLPKSEKYSHQIQLGFEDKLFENDIDFEGTPVGVDVRSQPVSLTYSGQWAQKGWQLGFHLGVNHNIEVSGLNNEETYSASRAGADANWTSYQGGLSVDYWLKQWLMRAYLEGQYANEPLISGEMFGLGGAGSVRGFQHRELVGDRGYRAGFETWTPALAPNLRLLAFIEGGQVRRLNSQPGETKEETIASSGLGLRWRWKDSLDARLDYGYVLDGLDGVSGEDVTTDNDRRAHFNLNYQF